jgi:hypothetical protein
MNEQEYQMALIEAKQEALNWQEKYMAQRDANAKQSEKIVRQSTRIAELEELYKGAQSKENERRVENLANGLSKMFDSNMSNFIRMKEFAESLIEQFKKG